MCLYTGVLDFRVPRSRKLNERWTEVRALVAEDFVGHAGVEQCPTFLERPKDSRNRHVWKNSRRVESRCLVHDVEDVVSVDLRYVHVNAFVKASSSLLNETWNL